MSYSDIEHFGNMVAGLESFKQGDGKSPDSIYAQTVLKLHANDAGFYAGQEGFLDSIKKGASNSLEWVKKLFEAIKKWFATAFKSTKAKFKSAVTGTDEEKEKKLKSIRAALITKVKAVQAGAKKAPEGVDAGTIETTGDKLVAALEEGVPAATFLAMDSFLTAIDSVEGKYVKYVGSKAPKGDESHAEYQKAVSEFKAFSTPVNTLTVYVDGLSNDK